MDFLKKLIYFIVVYVFLDILKYIYFCFCCMFSIIVIKNSINLWIKFDSFLNFNV